MTTYQRFRIWDDKHGGQPLGFFIFLLIVLMVFALCSCGTSPKPPPLYPIPKGKPVQEVVEGIQPALQDANASKAKLGEQLRQAEAQAERARTEAEEAQAMAKRLADKGEANTRELLAMWEQTKRVSGELLRVKGNNAELAKTNESLGHSLEEITRRNTDLIASAATSDQKIDLYEQQIKAQITQAQQLEKDKKTAVDAYNAVRTNYDKLRGQRNLLAWVAAILGAWQIIKILVLKRL
jgi:chromosome segregation ATPase